VDSVLRLFDPSGKQVASNDDQEDKSSGLNTHHADSYLSVTLQADGCYTVYLGDTQRGGGSAYAYRLRLSAPRPDFELRVTPPSINVRNGTSVPLTAFALRKDGFTNEIVLSLKDAPKDYRLTGAVIPANQEQIKFTLTPPLGTDQEPISLALEGRALFQGRTIVKPAMPSDDMKEDELVLQTDATKVKPGQKGNLIIMASGEPTINNKQTAVANKFRMQLGAFPAVSYEITK
jgi:hypothetical protein